MAGLRLYLLGHPVTQSRSPAMQNPALRLLGVPAVYETLDVLPEALEATLERLESDPAVLGCNVTVPHKVAAHAWLASRGRLLRSRSEIAQAVNTLFRGPDGLFQGDSTDFDGAISAIWREAFESDLERFQRDLSETDVGILGSGGSAQSIATNIVRPWHGARPRSVTIFARDLEKARAVANVAFWQHLHATPALLADFPAWNAGRRSLVIQTTTVGMEGGPAVGESPVPACLEPGQIAFDLVYKPHETRFLREARERGATVVHGIGMLAGQGAHSLAHWCSSLQPAPEFAFPAVLETMTQALQV